MGLLSSIGKAVGELTGIGSGGRSALEGAGGTSVKVEPDIFKEIYEAALRDLEMNPEDNAFQDQIRNIGIKQLGQLDNNSALRKKTFMQDTSRGLQGDLTNLARASGGTGGLASRNVGSIMDSTARARSRGLLDINDKAISDLAGISGIQSNLNSQNQNVGINKANLRSTELGQRRGLAVGNANQNATINSTLQQQRRQTADKAIQGLGGLAGWV